ncbi:MAG: DUF89 family protein [Proteobacteria bacterium]|nr:DUF89 family protein [Pseudomonadota bacterium]
MKPAADCFSCFRRQTEKTAILAGIEKNIFPFLLAEVEKIYKRFSSDLSPPEIAVHVYGLIAELSGNSDPYASLKMESTRQALNLMPFAQEKIKSAKDPLYASILHALAGNVIDYGSQHEFDIHQAFDTCLSNTPAINDYHGLKRDIHSARTILFLGDNCGEIVFDRLFIREMKKDVIFVVKEKPVINDATLSDARASGLESVCRVITNGTGCPGTPLAQCSEEFQQLFKDAELIISKGQGNFETLSEAKGPIYFLLTVKCNVVADHLMHLKKIPGTKIRTGDMVIMKNPGWQEIKRI